MKQAWLIAFVLVVGCSSSGEASREALEARAKDHAAAVLKGDAQASFGTLAAACKAKHPIGTWQELVKVGSAIGGGYAVEAVRVTEFTPPNAKTVTDLKSGDGTVLSGTEPSGWVVEDGQWVTTDCGD